MSSPRIYHLVLTAEGICLLVPGGAAPRGRGRSRGHVTVLPNRAAVARAQAASKAKVGQLTVRLKGIQGKKAVVRQKLQTTLAEQSRVADQLNACQQRLDRAQAAVEKSKAALTAAQAAVA